MLTNSLRRAGLLLLVNVVTAATSDEDSTVAGHDKVVVCYWGTWANYRPKEGKFVTEDIDGSLCTHLIYSFAGLDTSKWAIKTLDAWLDLEDNYGLKGFKKATDLKIKYPHLKVLIAIGGWNEGSTKYSQMAKDDDKRGKFVNSTVDFLTKHKFDGLDLDWEYPAKRGGSPEDKKSFIYLVRDLKAAFTDQKFLLTAAIGAGKATIDISYDVPAMYKYLDYVNVMCYDYHGKWDKKTGHNAPLRARPDEVGGHVFLNLEYTINYLIKKGAKPEKTVLGVPLYGRSFLLSNPTMNHMGDPAKSTSFAGPYTREQGFLGYNEICKELSAQGSNWTVVWEKCHQAPYMFRGDRWVSYDNERSVRLKANFAFEKKLGGVMVWSIETDDFKGLCNGSKFPLLQTLNNALSMNTKNGVTEVEEKCDPADYSTERTLVTRKPWSPPPASSSDTSDNNSGNNPPPSSSGGVCVKPNEPNPDPTDCSKFYLCANGVPHALTCQTGTLYSASLMTCDHTANVDCTARTATDHTLDNNRIEEQNMDTHSHNEPSRGNEVSNTSETSSEKIVMIILILVLLILCLSMTWCFRARIRSYAEPYLEKYSMAKMRRPSTIGLLKAYNVTKLGWSMQNKLSGTNMIPSDPPKEYSGRETVAQKEHSIGDLPSLPGVPVPPPRRKRSSAGSQNVETSQTNLPDTQSDA